MEQNKKERTVLLLIILYLLLSVVFIYLGEPVNDSDFLILAVILFWLSFLPFCQFLLYTKPLENFPFVPILAVSTTLSYSISVFFIHTTSYEVHALTLTGLKYAIFGYSVFYVSYVILYPTIKLNYSFNPINKPVTAGTIKALAIIFGIIHLAAIYFKEIPSLNHLGTYGAYIFYGSYIYLYKSKQKLFFSEYILLLALFMFEFFTRIISGYVLDFFLLFLFIYIINNIYKGSRLLSAFILIAFVMLYRFYAPIKYEYRTRVENATHTYTKIEKVRLLLGLFGNPQNYQADNKPKRYGDKINMLWRISYQSSVLSLVTDKTPDYVPYSEGKSYLVLSKFIPRLFWEDKPKEDASLDFARRYSLIPPDQKISPYPLPILPEFYMNFGDWGVFWGMIVLAIFTLAISKIYNSNKVTGINKVYATAIIFQFFFHEGNFTQTYGNIPLLSVSVILICRLYVNLASK